jgi:hypothetical protein
VSFSQKILIAIVASLLSLGMIIGGMYFSYSNSEIRLAAQVSAQQDANKAQYDTMWKVISQKAQIAEEYKDSFKSIYPAIMEGRYGNERGGSLMSWIQESNPNFDVSLYKDLMVSVEGQRERFLREQQELIDLNREHDLVIDTFPGSLFVGGRPKITITIVTSGKTDAAFATGQEDDVDLFKKNQ